MIFVAAIVGHHGWTSMLRYQQFNPFVIVSVVTVCGVIDAIVAICLFG
jgi:hypothetical protein